MSDFHPDRKPGPAARIFRALVLSRAGAILVLAATLAITGFLAWRIRDFEMDASSDSITLKDDHDLRFYDKSRFDFGADEFAVVVVQTDSIDTLLSDRHIDMIDRLQRKLEAIPAVDTTLSILDAPLFHSPEIPLLMARNFNTLRSPKTDRELAKKELLESPIFDNYIIARDEAGVATAIMVNFDPDWDYLNLEREYQILKTDVGARPDAPAEEKAKLAELKEKWEAGHVVHTRGRQEGIRQIRAVMAEFERDNKEIGKLTESGVAMVIADMVSFIQRDIVWFTTAALFFMILTLIAVFRGAKWVLVPLTTCIVCVLILFGYLGYSHWRTTMVSSNSGALLLILNMSMSIHIAARYRELHAEHPEKSNRELILAAVARLFVPCLFMVMTAMVGFGSLYFSGIVPVMDFGKMMIMGLTVSFALCFLFMPALMAMLPKGTPPKLHKLDTEHQSGLVHFATFAERMPRFNGVFASAIFLVCAFGATRISPEARFLDYFRESTKINTSMTMIDKRLGGTMSLEVVLDGDSDDYWLQPENLKRLAGIHKFIDDLPQTGKVVSLATVNQVLEGVNKGKPISAKMIKTALDSLPDHLRAQIVKPYATPDYRRTRIWIRVRESDKNLRRTELRNTIAKFLAAQPGLKLDDNAHITGYFVLYNNMINSLIASQITTFGYELAIIWVMFLILHRSFLVAVIMLVPNIFPVAMILGVMGWFGIHLDMMTVMIASVTFGVAVDDTIHYTHRFRDEFPKYGNYVQTMRHCHNTVGRAMFSSSATVVIGFSILTLSEFVPTVYFGLFTALAMVIAFYAVIVLLPLLIITLKPFGPERAPAIPPTPEASGEITAGAEA